MKSVWVIFTLRVDLTTLMYPDELGMVDLVAFEEERKAREFVRQQKEKQQKKIVPSLVLEQKDHGFSVESKSGDILYYGIKKVMVNDVPTEIYHILE